MHTFRLFVSSPGDADVERRRTENVVSRLNGEFAGLARLVTIRWETEFYQAHETFQTQIPPAAECDIVVGILRWRLGTQLPPTFADQMPGGEPYPSGTAYEILTAIEKRKTGSELPDVFVFRFTESPTIKIDGSDREGVEREWAALRSFFKRWFITSQGHFIAALNDYAAEDAFEERLERLLRKWLADKVASGRVVPWPATKGSPFRGLGVFGARHAPVFFGRSGDIRRATDLWRDYAGRGTRFLLVVGASGAGKSSLARAGLIPRLTTPGVVPQVDGWRVAVMHPGDDPNDLCAALAQALLRDQNALPPEEDGRGPALPEIAEGDSKTPADLATVLAHADAGAVRPIVNALERIGERARASARSDRALRYDLVLLVDQLDKMFAPSVAPEARRRFAELLLALVASQRVWLVVTLRADLYESMLQVEALKQLKDTGASFDLVPPGAAELAEIVREPASAAGLVFETDSATGERLDERLLREAERPDMLPLVQLALSRLWEARETRNGEAVLPIAAFQRLGGVKGIIEEAGETALASVGETAGQAMLPPLIRQLAELSHGNAPGPSGGVTARAVALTDAAADGEARRLVDALVAARLLTLAGEGGATQVRLAHQRVLTDWARAARIVADSADFYRVRDEVEEQRRRWEAGKRRGELLLARGLPLAEARAVAAQYGTELSPAAHGFIAASRRRANRAQMIGWATAAVFALLAIGAGIGAKVAIDQTARTEAARREAEAQRTRAERNFDAAKQTVDGLIFNIAQGLQNVAGMRKETIRKILETVRHTVDRLMESAPEDDRLLRSRVAMLVSFASTYELAGDVEAANGAAEEGLEIARKLAARSPGDRDARHSLAVMLHHLAEIRLDDDDLPGALTAFDESLGVMRTLAAKAPDDARAQREIAAALTAVGKVRERRRDLGGALKAYEESLGIFRRLLARKPKDVELRDDVLLTLGNIGDVKLELADPQGALAADEESLAIARGLAAEDPDDALAQRYLSVSLNRVGEVKQQANDLAAALAAYEESLRISRKLAAQDAGNARAQRDVALVLTDIGNTKVTAEDRPGALAAFEDALTILRRLARNAHGDSQASRDVAVVLGKVGRVKLQLGDRAGALAVFEESLAIDREALALSPESLQSQRDLTIALEALADVKLQAGDTAGALLLFAESLAARRKLSENIGGAPSLQDLSATLGRIGRAKLRAGDGHGARAAFAEAVDVDRRLASQSPSSVQRRTDLAADIAILADAKLQGGDVAGSLTTYEESLAIRRDLATRIGDVRSRRAYVSVLDTIGAIKRRAGDTTGALAAYGQSLAVTRTLAAQAPGPKAERDIAVALATLGRVKQDAGDVAGAFQAYEESAVILRALAARPSAPAEAQRDLAVVLERLGDARYKVGDAAGALRAYDESLALFRRVRAGGKPDDADAQRAVSSALNRVGDARLKLGDKAGAVAAYREGIAIDRGLAAKDPGNLALQRDLAISLDTLADLEDRAGDAAAALARYEESLAIRRTLAAKEPDASQVQRALADSLESAATARLKTHDGTGGLALLREAVGIADRWLARPDAKSPEGRKWVRFLGGIAYSLVLAGDFSAALTAADRALAAAPQLTFVQGNRAHALMFLGRLVEAKAIYLRYRGTRNVVGNKQWEETVRNDFADFRQFGRTSPLMAEIEAAFRLPPS